MPMVAKTHTKEPVANAFKYFVTGDKIHQRYYEVTLKIKTFTNDLNKPLE